MVDKNEGRRGLEGQDNICSVLRPGTDASVLLTLQLFLGLCERHLITNQVLDRLTSLRR